MATRTTKGKTTRPAAKKLSAPRKAAAKTLEPTKKVALKSAGKAKAATSGRKAHAASAGRISTTDSLETRFDGVLQRVKQRNEELTADLDALIAGLK